MRPVRLAVAATLGLMVGLAFRAAPLVSQNPFSTAADIAEGERIFQLDCATCHGGDARGGRGPDLTRGTFRHASDDEQLFRIVRNGIPGTEMPRRVRTDERAWKVVSYLRTLGGRGGELPPGDPERGRELFFGAASCSTCHMVDGEGSLQGPDLSLIGWQRSLDYLRTSVLDPNVEVDPRWWTAQLTTLDGARASGYLLDEDLHTVRLLDIEGNLVSLPKAGLSEFEPIKTSRMPSYAGVLSDEDVDNVLAYLASLHGEEMTQ
jgi:cytochrome c oxidase cbb3-type subunit 3